MKRLFVALFLSLFFFQCATRTTSSENALKPIANAEEYSALLEGLSIDVASSQKGLDMFQKSFVKDNQQENDKALRAFMDYQNRLIDTLEQKLFSDNEFYAKLESSETGSTTEVEPSVNQFKQKLDSGAMQLVSSEGSVFLEVNPVKYKEVFGPHLTAGGLQFLNGLIREINEPYSEDGGLVIPLDQLAERLLFWDSYVATYPNDLFFDDAQSHYKGLLYALMTGLDNTQAYDMETQAWHPQYLAMYKKIVDENNGTQTAATLSEFLKVLGENGNKYNEAVSDFIGKVI